MAVRQRENDVELWVAAGTEAGDDRGMLMTCQAGYENYLGRELEDTGGRVVERGPGWVLVSREACASSNSEDPTVSAQTPVGALLTKGRSVGPDLAFAHRGLIEPVEIVGESVNALAQRVAEFFLASLQGERVEAAWPCMWAGPQEIVGLGRRVSAVEAAFGELLKKRLSRVARLAVKELPHGVVGEARGLFVYFTDFRRAFVARTAWSGGQRRMADDAFAPSRSFLKIEEAYGVLGREPAIGETIADLGAAPGGWSYSAAKRGARVIAVDNGPLKGGALGHALIEHRREDAFGFRMAAGAKADWMFCDLVDEPHHVLRGIVAPWLEGAWCRRFVVNLKFGRVDPVALLRETRGVIDKNATSFCIRHLYHDREEFTVVGETRGQ